jgi:hypothetical protein
MVHVASYERKGEASEEECEQCEAWNPLPTEASFDEFPEIEAIRLL